ncbi:hypothetical protein [Profundibacter sp.]
MDIEIKAIRPDPDSNKMLGSVTFHISGGIGNRCDIMNFECSCKIPLGDTSDERLSYIKQGLKADALRQAKRMPEFRAGKDRLVLLPPQEQNAA